MIQLLPVQRSVATSVETFLSPFVTIKQHVVIPALRTPGEMRKGYHKQLSAVLVGELDKDLTGHSVPQIEKALETA